VRQSRLMKLSRNNIDRNCLLPDAVCIAFSYFLNSPHSSLKYAIQFLFSQTPQNLLQALKKLILISHLNPLEFFLTVGNKQKSLEARSNE
jgi:hypothetical protein